MSDYPAIGVCSWKEWSQEAACWMLDGRRGNLPVTVEGWQRFRFCLRQVRQRPFTTNPWRRYFARYAMTPWEAYKTINRT